MPASTLITPHNSQGSVDCWSPRQSSTRASTTTIAEPHNWPSHKPNVSDASPGLIQALAVCCAAGVLDLAGALT